MARRYCGDATVNIWYVGTTPGGREQYRGSVCAGKARWRFDDICSGVGGVSSGKGYAYASDSPQAYDEMAETALSFATYYTSHNRGPDCPEWAPEPEVADALDAAAYDYSDDGRRVTRKR